MLVEISSDENAAVAYWYAQKLREKFSCNEFMWDCIVSQIMDNELDEYFSTRGKAIVATARQEISLPTTSEISPVLFTHFLKKELCF